MTTSSSSTIYMGTALKFQVDQSHTTLELVQNDGSQINVWGQTLKYAFAPQQTMVTLYLTPAPGTEVVFASCIDGQGNTVPCTQQSGSAVLTLQRPPSTGFIFDIDVQQDSASVAAVGSAPAATARMASASTPTETRPGPALTVSRQAGSVASGATGALQDPTGPGARLQTRLVLTTVEPPPDPDARPTIAGS
jgi:hypothetical protein